jgi:hypothetical protein
LSTTGGDISVANAGNITSDATGTITTTGTGDGGAVTLTATAWAMALTSSPSSTRAARTTPQAQASRAAHQHQRGRRRHHDRRADHFGGAAGGSDAVTHNGFAGGDAGNVTVEITAATAARTFRSLPSLLSVARARTAPTALQPAHRVRPEQTRGPLGTPALLVRQVPLARTALPVPTVSPLVRTAEMDNLAATVIRPGRRCRHSWRSGRCRWNRRCGR